MIESRPQPYYDHELARICEWLRARRLSMHVTLRGEVSFRPAMCRIDRRRLRATFPLARLTPEGVLTVEEIRKS